MRPVRSVSAILIACALCFSASAGELDPPGPPAPTSLGTDPRTPIVNADLPLTIDIRGGSYYFAEPLKFDQAMAVAIFVSERYVTIDLNGFSLEGPSALSGGRDSIGIQVGSAAREVNIRNGTVALFGDDGIRIASRGAHVEDLNVFDCGQVGIEIIGENAVVRNCIVQSCDVNVGIRVGNGSVVEGCVARDNLGGISAGEGCTVVRCSSNSNGSGGITVGASSTVAECAAINNTFNGISAGRGSVVRGCSAMGNGSSGIDTSFGCTVVDCSSSGNDLDGFQVASGTMVVRCNAFENGSDGIQAASQCLVADNLCTDNGQDFDAETRQGIIITGDEGRIDNNHVLGSPGGTIWVSGVNNVIVRNSAHPDNFGITVGADNMKAPEVGTFIPDDPGPWDNLEPQ